MGTRNPAELLDDIVAFLKRHIAYPDEHAAHVHALWIMHTHLMDEWESTPRLAFLSPEPGSGKTRALELTELLVPRPIESVNASPAYIFRKVNDPDGLPTILYDEIDTVFGPKARENEELRGLLNAGHRKGATAGRCTIRGKEIVTEEFPAYSAVAMAGLGNLPDTILSRSILIKMRKRSPDEKVEPYRRREHAPIGHALRNELAKWAESIRGSIMSVPPVMPDEVTDRNADVWEPLLAVADAAGGHWPETARVAAVTYVTRSAGEAPSIGVNLLKDIREIFGTLDRMSSQDLVMRLNAKPEAPWAELEGRPLNQRGLSAILKQYDIAPKPMRIGTAMVRGYERSDFADAWKRYLPASS